MASRESRERKRQCSNLGRPSGDVGVGPSGI